MFKKTFMFLYFLSTIACIRIFKTFYKKYETLENFPRKSFMLPNFT